jgi:hypothetical protein
MLDGIAPKDITSTATHEYRRELDQNTVVGAEPVLTGPVARGSMSTRVVISNGTDVVQTFDGTWQPREGLSFSPAQLNVVLDPGQARAWDVTIATRHPLPVSDIISPAIDWTRTFTPQGYDEVSQDWQTFVPIDTLHPCVPARESIVVDGDLSDWPVLPYCVDTENRMYWNENWDGPDDSSFVFGVARDDDYIYIGLDATDDALMVDKAPVPWQQDSISITFDARPRTGRVGRVWVNEQFDTHLLYYLSPSLTNGMIWYVQEKAPEGSQAVCVPTDTGLALEIAIPVDYLDELQGGDWQDFQLNISMNDVDPVGKTLLRWRSDWYHGRLADEGTFVRME